MTGLKNDRLIKALLRAPVDRTPVWIMRQAGRYLPEYRKVRAEAGSFLKLCTTPELACEVTLQPLRRFPVDAAILFSDILTIPDAMGLDLYFVSGEGPKFAHPLREADSIHKLAVPDPEADLGYVMDAIRLARRELDGEVPLIGFSGSPWTLATYMVEGGSSKDFALTKQMLYDRPDLMHTLLAKNADAVAAYLTAQVHAGAQALMIFDTWGGVLTPQTYKDFSMAYMRRIVEQLPREHAGVKIPVIGFTKNAGTWLKDMTGTGCDCLGVDWTISLADARKLTEDRVALQGNLDPSVLYASPAVIEEKVGEVLAEYGDGPGHVFNLGHGVHPGIDPDHVLAMVEAVQKLSPAYKQ